MDSNSHGIGESYAECVTMAWDDGVAIEFIPWLTVGELKNILHISNWDKS